MLYSVHFVCNVIFDSTKYTSLLQGVKNNSNFAMYQLKKVQHLKLLNVLKVLGCGLRFSWTSHFLDKFIWIGSYTLHSCPHPTLPPLCTAILPPLPSSTPLTSPVLIPWPSLGAATPCLSLVCSVSRYLSTYTLDEAYEASAILYSAKHCAAYGL